MNNKKKNRSIFEKKGFYIALYSCIGVVLVLAIGISFNTLGRDGTDMMGRRAPEQGTTAPTRQTTNDNVMDEVRIEEGSIRDILPILPRQNDTEESAPLQEPQDPAQPAPQPEPPQTQAGRTPEPPQEPSPEAAPQNDAGLTYVPDAIPVMQPLDAYAMIAAADDNAQPPEDETPQEVTIIQWDDDPVVAHGNILADPVFNIFTGNNDMGWPVRGDIVMDFSVDSLIHDVTLNQFRTNDKISISANVGTQVRAASDGVVRSVENDRRLGNTVVIEHGNGWFTTYSQLQEHVLVAVGDVVIKDQVIGGVGQPSIFYTLLGSHLSFRVTRDDVAVNPLLVLGH